MGIEKKTKVATVEYTVCVCDLCKMEAPSNTRSNGIPISWWHMTSEEKKLSEGWRGPDDMLICNECYDKMHLFKSITAKPQNSMPIEDVIKLVEEVEEYRTEWPDMAAEYKTYANKYQQMAAVAVKLAKWSIIDRLSELSAKMSKYNKI